MNQYQYDEFSYQDLMPFSTMTPPNQTNLIPGMPVQPSIPSGNIPNLATPAQGYMQGNLFNNLYQGYKNYRPQVLTPQNDQERRFLELSQMSFAAHELNLYLDIHPDNQAMIQKFNEYRVATNRAMEAYEAQYGPLTLSSNTLTNTPWLWATLNFPWDKGGM